MTADQDGGAANFYAGERAHSGPSQPPKKEISRQTAIGSALALADAGGIHLPAHMAASMSAFIQPAMLCAFGDFGDSLVNWRQGTGCARCGT